MFKNKRGQLKISFGMIFSIILIIIFIVFAIFAIVKVLDLNKEIQIKTFKNSLSNDVETVWKSASTSTIKTYYLPKSVEYICFADLEIEERDVEIIDLSDLERAYFGDENLFLYPVEKNGYESTEIKNLDLGKIVTSQNPYCIKNEDGKIKLLLKKEFNENLVTISRN
jgi:hypothetical protein